MTAPRPMLPLPTGRMHILKCWREPFDALADCRKTHEWRRADRDYQVRDLLRLREWSPAEGTYTGRELVAVVTYVTRGGEFGVPPDFVVLSVRVIQWPDGERLLV